MDKWLTRIKDIVDDPHKFVDKENVILKGICRSWQHEEGRAVNQGPPVSKSDWILRDSTDAIYVQGAVLFYPKHLHPVEDLDKEVLLAGQVVMSESASPFPFISMPEEPLPSYKTIKGKLRYVSLNEGGWILDGFDLNSYQLAGESEELHQQDLHVEVTGFVRPELESILEDEIVILQVCDYKIL
ncbi:MAG: hypothetical protein M1269_05095 [Chloroflexi bacterium]|nr:hypothetical protein [Chloroflexota bacterium]